MNGKVINILLLSYIVGMTTNLLYSIHIFNHNTEIYRQKTINREKFDNYFKKANHYIKNNKLDSSYMMNDSILKYHKENIELQKLIIR